MVAPFVIRRGRPGDADALIADTQTGFDGYAEFAPAGWTPPDVGADRARIQELLADPAAWISVAVHGDAVVGHAGFFPARERAAGERRTPEERAVVPGLVHLWQLFILPAWWGRGPAPVLHDAAIAEMAARGYDQARLFTPAGQARARAFYERRGWTMFDQAPNPDLGLELVEYQPGDQPLRALTA